MAPRLVMVSGGARGLGAALVRRCLEDGYRVSVGARSPDAVVEAFGDRVTAHRFDADDPATAQSWVDATVAQMGAPDALINNAGILRMVTFEKGDEDDLDAM